MTLPYKRVLTILAPVSLGFSQDALASSKGVIPSGGEGALGSQTHVGLTRLLQFLVCDLCSFPDLPEPTFLTEKWVKHDSLPGSPWRPNELQGGGTPELAKHTGSTFSV